MTTTRRTAVSLPTRRRVLIAIRWKELTDDRPQQMAQLPRRPARPPRRTLASTARRGGDRRPTLGSLLGEERGVTPRGQRAQALPLLLRLSLLELAHSAPPRQRLARSSREHASPPEAPSSAPPPRSAHRDALTDRGNAPAPHPETGTPARRPSSDRAAARTSGQARRAPGQHRSPGSPSSTRAADQRPGVSDSAQRPNPGGTTAPPVVPRRDAALERSGVKLRKTGSALGHLLRGSRPARRGSRWSATAGPTTSSARSWSSAASIIR